MSLFLGFDTSNYTTSAAVCGGVERSCRRILDVAEGMRGIRQSDGVFAHIKQLPQVYAELSCGIDLSKVSAVGVSSKPRSEEGSYMPVFLVGRSFASVVSDTLGVPMYEFSHQDGHIMAGISSANREDLIDSEFLGVHLSGGTLELFKTRFNGKNFNVELVGGTKDISAGQLIDRIGVKMGMKFPCGGEMDEISLRADKPVKLKTCVNDGFINLSGLENKLSDMIDTTEQSVIALTAFDVVARSVIEAIGDYKGKILIVGGVAANNYIREKLLNLDNDICFASRELSCDNALGIAKLTELNFGM